jgi:hypothetical protein
MFEGVVLRFMSLVDTIRTMYSVCLRENIRQQEEREKKNALSM